MKLFKGIFKENSSYLPFLISILTMGLGYGLYKGVIDNYLAEIVRMSEFDKGLTEFFRELPGVCLVFILAAFYLLSAEKVYKIGSLIMLVGMGLHFALPSARLLVTLAICMYSLGEHIQLGMKNTLSLQYAKPNMGGTSLGLASSASQIGHLIGFFVIMVCFSKFVGVTNYKLFFAIATIITAIGVLASFAIKGDTRPDKTASRFYFRKKFSKFYMLEVFYGARKQVFFTFGPYVLILHYGASASQISLLFAISAICGFIASPLVGKLIDKVGYKPVMISDTLILVIVCLCYGFAHRIFPMNVAFVICCVNYVLDSIISLASMASNVYVKDISDSDEEVRATISTGISVNHVISVLIALFGGWIWSFLGIETLFILSAVLGLANSAYAATIKVKKKTA